MNEKVNGQKNTWDELGDIDELLDGNGSSSLDFLPVSLGSELRVDAQPHKLRVKASSPGSEENQEALAACSQVKAKPRRRSALLDDETTNTKTKVVGYSHRTRRLVEQGQPIRASAELVEEDKGEFNRLLAKGVYLLGMREHSVQEMTNKLTARSEFVHVVLAVVDELIGNNYLSNERFAESYVRSRRNKGFGPVKIRLELKTKGINSRLILEYLNAESPEWIDIAREQYEKKYRHRVEEYKEWTKRARFMQSRGFTMEHIQAVLPSTEFY